MRYIAILIGFVFFINSCKNNNGSESINLETVSGKKFSLKELKNKKAAVFVFLSSQCPLSQAYAKEISAIEKKYAPFNIVFYSVFPPENNSLNEISEFKNKYGLKTECLADPEKKLTLLLKATTTPQAIILSPSEEILYSGRIDDWAATLSDKRPLIRSHDLDDALNSVVNNREIKIKNTAPVGCLIE